MDRAARDDLASGEDELTHFQFDSVPTIFKVVRFLCGLGHGVGKVVAMRCLDGDTVVR